MIAAIPARDVLRAALFKRRHKEAVRILIVVACLSTCRRGRSAMSYTLCKVRVDLFGKRERDGKSDAGGDTKTSICISYL